MLRLSNRKQFIKNIPYEELPPKCILQILKCHGKDADEAKFLTSEKYRHKCYQHVMEGEDLIVNLSKKKDLARMIRYINPTGEFSDIDLVKNIAESLQEPEDFIAGFSNYTVGFPTEQLPKCIPMDVLLWIAYRKGLVIDPRYSEEDVHRIISLNSMSEETLQTRMINRILGMNVQDLIRQYGHELLKVENDSIDSLLAISTSKSHPLFPRFPQEAVAMAALKFCRDITMSSDPMKEYENILVNKPSTDPILLEAISKDKFALDLKQRFRSYIPERLYNGDALKRMAEEEGYMVGCGQSYYDYLYSIREHDTFYAFGKGPAESYPRSNEYLLVQGDRIEGMDRSELLSYGNIHKPNASLVVVSYQELLDTFRFYKEFRNPLTDGYEIFSDRSIRKLKILTQKACADARVHEVRLSLYRQIVHIETFIRKRNTDLLIMKDELGINHVNRNKMIHLLTMLLDIGKAARSFDTDKDEFPYYLGSASDSQTENNVAVRLVELFNKCREDEGIGERFLSLLMMRYDQTSGTFQVSNDTYDGLTIRDRLDILAKGDTVNEMSSCIRLTSNWLCHTSYYYIVMLGDEPPFEISKLRRVG